MTLLQKHITKTILILCSICCFNFANSQKSEYKKIIDSLKKVSDEIKYKNIDSAIIVFTNLANYHKLDNNINSYYITRSNLANCYLIQQKNNEALEVYLDCAKYFKKNNDSVNLYTVYSGIAGIYFNLNDEEKVISHLKMATQICNAAKFPNLKFIVNVNLGNCFVLSKQYDSAFQCYQQANGLVKYLKEPNYAYQLKVEFA